MNGIVQSNFWLRVPGTLINAARNSDGPSIDPLAYFDVAPTFVRNPVVDLIAANLIADPIDPTSGTTYLSWAALPASEPQFQLLSSGGLGDSAIWNPATASPIVQINGLFETALLDSQPEGSFRLAQNALGSQFKLFAATDGNGFLSLIGAFSAFGMANRTFSVNCWRSATVVKALPQFVSTPICSQLVWPVKAPGPKSISTVNRPLVTGPATTPPPLLALNSEKVKV